VAGLVRQQVIAAAFGVGAAYDAYNYAYVLPGFLLILLGGINGPFHSAMVSVLARRPRQEGAHVLAAINTWWAWPWWWSRCCCWWPPTP
jgi:putative peptidoglycan lipid II flippase